MAWVYYDWIYNAHPKADSWDNNNQAAHNSNLADKPDNAPDVGDTCRYSYNCKTMNLFEHQNFYHCIEWNSQSLHNEQPFHWHPCL